MKKLKKMMSYQKLKRNIQIITSIIKTIIIIITIIMLEIKIISELNEKKGTIMNHILQIQEIIIILIIKDLIKILISIKEIIIKIIIIINNQYNYNQYNNNIKIKKENKAKFQNPIFQRNNYNNYPKNSIQNNKELQILCIICQR